MSISGERSLVQKDNEVWIRKGKMEIHVATAKDDGLHLQPIDPTMANIMGIEVDEAGYAVIDRQEK